MLAYKAKLNQWSTGGSLKDDLVIKKVDEKVVNGSSLKDHSILIFYI